MLIRIALICGSAWRPIRIARIRVGRRICVSLPWPIRIALLHVCRNPVCRCVLRGTRADWRRHLYVWIRGCACAHIRVSVFARIRRNFRLRLTDLACTICCCLAKETGGGGGATFATTGRAATAGGGVALAAAPAPRTLRCCGATVVGATGATGAEAISFWSTRIMLLCTFPADVNVWLDTAVTAFTCVWF